MKESSVFGLVDIGYGISMECCGLTVKIPAGEIFRVLRIAHTDFLVGRIDCPQQGGHDEKLRVVPGSLESDSDLYELDIKAHVLMTTSWGSTPYFFANRTLSIVASKPFNEDMLSANRQLMGILGALDPTYFTLRPYSRASGGRLFEIKGFPSILASKSFRLCCGTEYVSGESFSVVSRLPIIRRSHLSPRTNLTNTIFSRR